MLEIPELEILRRDLEREINDRKIKEVDLALVSLVKPLTKKAFVAGLEGLKISGVSRKGMLILIGIQGEHTLVLHVGEHTRLTRNQAKDPSEPGTVLTITFTQGGQLRIVDPKKEARVELIETDKLAEAHPELAELGVDPVDEPISWTTFGEELLRREGKLKAILMDQSFIVGIGPMYSDEILFHAGLRFDRTPSSLSTQEIRRLYRALVETVHDAVKYGGTTLGDDGWVGLLGEPGGYGEYITVYKRDGQMSPRARGPIVKSRFGNGYTYYCEQTQV